EADDLAAAFLITGVRQHPAGRENVVLLVSLHACRHQVRDFETCRLHAKEADSASVELEVLIEVPLEHVKGSHHPVDVARGDQVIDPAALITTTAATAAPSADVDLITGHSLG